MNDSFIIYPQNGYKIDTFDKRSEYLVKIEAPKDICMSFNEYSVNFYNSANIIVNILLYRDYKDISKLDTYFFSIAFLYRHSLELKLKAIAFKTIISDSDRSNFIKDNCHDLLELLNTIEKNFLKFRSKKEFEWLQEYFSDISKIDKKSDSFRYPFHIKCEERCSIDRIFDEQTHIDLIKFVNKFEAAYEILDKWYTKSLDEAIEWKALKPIFIEEGGIYYGQSVVGNIYFRDDSYPYTVAYLDTANYLSEHMREYIELGNDNETSGLFIPMFYLYRNCVELNLKTIWFEEIGEDFENRCRHMRKKKHSIVGMWNLIKPYVNSYAKERSDKEYIETLEDYCYQLHSIDSDSSKFRYPVKKDMTPYFKENKRFDFIHTGIFLESLNNGLNSVCILLNVMNDYKAEIQSNCYYY